LASKVLSIPIVPRFVLVGFEGVVANHDVPLFSLMASPLLTAVVGWSLSPSSLALNQRRTADMATSNFNEVREATVAATAIDNVTTSGKPSQRDSMEVRTAE